MGLLQAGRHDQCGAVLGKAYTKMQSSPAVNYHMGMIAFKDGRKAEAKEYLTKATKSSEEFEGKEEATKALAKL